MSEPEVLPAKVNLRPESAQKWVAISKSRRWTFAETADALADSYLEHNDDIEPPEAAPVAVSTPSGANESESVQTGAGATDSPEQGDSSGTDG